MSTSPSQTLQMANKLSATLLPGHIIALSGSLGAGKTTFVKGLAKGLRIKQTIKSPTFVFFHLYEGGKCPLYHFDLYRVEREDDLIQIGFSDYINESNAISVIEWAERATSIIPTDVIQVEIQVKGLQERRFVFSATGPSSQTALKPFVKK